MASYRAAGVEEDDKLSLILCNAFLPLWYAYLLLAMFKPNSNNVERSRNHNWFQNISAPLEPVQFTEDYKPQPPLTSLQSSRVQFYHGLIKMTRAHEGSIYVASLPSDSTSDVQDVVKRDDIGAILLWLPPKKRFSLPSSIPKLATTGFLRALRGYGLRCIYRIQVIFEGNVEQMFNATVKPKSGFHPADCGFVQMVAINPKYAGKGYASALLKWKCEQHFQEFKRVPVILDTTTEQGIRAYKRLGFDLLDERKVATGTDAGGFPLKKDAEENVKEEAARICIQRVMIKIPGMKGEVN
jgi:GNAT superfamily N-acetyltransferase